METLICRRRTAKPPSHELIFTSTRRQNRGETSQAWNIRPFGHSCTSAAFKAVVVETELLPMAVNHMMPTIHAFISPQIQRGTLILQDFLPTVPLLLSTGHNKPAQRRNPRASQILPPPGRTKP